MEADPMCGHAARGSGALPGLECSWVFSRSAPFYGACVSLSSTDNSLLNYTSLSFFTNSSPNGEGTVTILFHHGPLMDKAVCCLLGPP